MRRLILDFSSKKEKWQIFSSYFALALMLAAISYQGIIYRELSVSLDRWETKWRSLQMNQRISGEADAKQKMPSEQLLMELKSANRVIRHLSMPWDELFREIEASLNEEVTLLSVEPDTEKQEIRITAEAKNLIAMLDYMKRVQDMTSFKDAHIENHQIQVQDSQRPVRFLISAQWFSRTKSIATSQ
ncbi:MAG: hypothetical protein Q7T66_05545 [Herminiimonas sp.]|uniref:hypothetical protein n=1 Tax=Herminiimonas sp. TaxID=1926289 RepID=UPI0027228D86|nr:hypothetical protein [Herminiimonas sp.]MDO9420111.1 hypothetical protein [Herminiimonas sp.]